MDGYEFSILLQKCLVLENESLDLAHNKSYNK
jgi:hypothetical protein